MDTKKTLASDIEVQHINPYNAQHIGMREEQQDYFAFSDIFNTEEYQRIGAVAVLSDGMGGLADGRRASRMTVDVFLNTYRETETADINDRLLYAAKEANEYVQTLEGAGSTLCAVVIKDGRLYWLSIGDSRIYLYRNGSLRQLNKEHNYEKVLNEKVLNGELSLAQAVNDPNRAALTSYIGMGEIEEIDLNRDIFPVFKGDSVLLCSDGLYRALSEEEMAFALKNAGTNVCDVLVKRALAKNIEAQDNITVVLMDVD